MARNYTECVQAVFEPLADACNFQHRQLLKTIAPADERKDKQFSRFKNLKIDSSRASPIATGGFVAVASELNLELLLVCAPSLNEQEGGAFADLIFDKLKIPSVEFDEATLLVLAKELPGLLKLNSKHRNTLDALNILDIIDDDYKGHDLLELASAFQPVWVFEISPDHFLHARDISEIVLNVASVSPQLRSPILTDEVAQAIIDLDGKVGCSSFNLEQAINAAQWRHAFLDIYRCLESIFYFPWMYKIKEVMKPGARFVELRDRFREDLRWSAKEKESISELFLLVSSDRMKEIETSSNFFKEIANDRSAKRDAFGRRVYFARNSLVHHEDREQPDTEIPSSGDYQMLTLYICEFLKAFDSMFGRLCR